MTRAALSWVVPTAVVAVLLVGVLVGRIVEAVAVAAVLYVVCKALRPGSPARDRDHIAR